MKNTKMQGLRIVEKASEKRKNPKYKPYIITSRNVDDLFACERNSRGFLGFHHIVLNIFINLKKNGKKIKPSRINRYLKKIWW